MTSLQISFGAVHTLLYFTIAGLFPLTPMTVTPFGSAPVAHMEEVSCGPEGIRCTKFTSQLPNHQLHHESFSTVAENEARTVRLSTETVSLFVHPA